MYPYPNFFICNCGHQPNYKEVIILKTEENLHYCSCDICHQEFIVSAVSTSFKKNNRDFYWLPLYNSFFSIKDNKSRKHRFSVQKIDLFDNGKISQEPQYIIDDELIKKISNNINYFLENKRNF